MQTLDAIKTDGQHKILLIGAPGSGKTCFAASFPGPILYLDFDNKVDSAALFHKAKPELLRNVDVINLSIGLTGDPYAELQKAIRELMIQPVNAGTFKYKTVVLDSISAFSNAALRHIMTTNPGIKGRQTAQGSMPDKPHYGVLLKEFERLIPGMLTLPCNIIMCAHLETWKDETTGMIIRGPTMDGSFDQQLPRYFKECWYTYVNDKGQYVAQTRADMRFACLRSQIPGLPNPLPLNYSELQKYL